MPNEREMSMSKFSCAVSCILLSGLVAVAMWLPFGFEMGAVIEEWGFFGLYVKDEHFFVAGLERYRPDLAMRPLTFTMMALANWLESHSFVPWHVLLILSIVLKGAAGGWWVARLTKSAMLGAVGVLLFILYPADTMQFTLRSLHIDWAITLVMLGVCMLIWSLERSVRPIVYVTALLAGVLFVGGIAMYEAPLALLLMVPGYFFVKIGARETIALFWKRAGVLVPFVLIAGIYAAYLISASGVEGAYQSSLIGKQSIVAVLLATFPKLFSVGALHVFLGGWVDAYRILVEHPLTNIAYLTACAVGLLAAIMVIVRLAPENHQQEGDPRRAFWSAVRLMMVGGLMALAGYFPYLLSLPHLSISQRTFLAATPGAALVWIGILILIGGRSRVMVLAGTAVAVLLGLSFQLHQFSHYQYLSNLQRRLLGEVVSQYGQRAGETSIVVRDYSNLLGHTWLFLPENLRDALSYVVGSPVGRLEICRQPAGEWMRLDRLGRTGRCREIDGQWVFEDAPPVSGPGFPALDGEGRAPMKWPSATTVVIDVGRSFSLDGDVASGRISTPVASADATDPTGLYVNWPLSGLLWKPSYRIGECYKWNFGDVWSLDLPIRGNGWREAEWVVSGLNKLSSSWKTAETASLHFEIKARDGDYILRFSMSAAANDQILKGLGLSVNGADLELALTGLDGVAVIPAGVINDGLNVLEFKSALAKDYYGLSIMLDRVTIEPRSFGAGLEGAEDRRGC